MHGSLAHRGKPHPSISARVQQRPQSVKAKPLRVLRSLDSLAPLPPMSLMRGGVALHTRRARSYTSHSIFQQSYKIRFEKAAINSGIFM
jgi:hypothetical protein